MRARAWTLAFAIALLATLPLLLRGPSCGHDFDFHLDNWLAVRESWRQGLLAPHWLAAANYGAGEPRFVFYPPLTWLLGAGLGLLLPWAWVPSGFTGVCLFGAGAAMYGLARRFCAPTQAGLAAMVYAASPYLLFTAYERTAYGELLAAAWMPLLLNALMRPRVPVVPAAIAVAALWYTNAPSGVMGCYLVLLSFVWHLRGGLFQAALQHGGALLLGGLLAADYLLPAWFEQRWVTIARAIGPGMRIRDSFLFEHTGELFHDQVLHTASLIAVCTVAVGLLAGVVALRRTGLAGALRRASEFCLVLLAAVFLLQLPLSGPVWRALPELQFLQFPWRLLLPGSAAAALLLGLALRDVRKAGRVVAVGAALVYLAGVTTWAGTTRYQPCDEEDNVPAQIALLHSSAGFEGTDEYAAAGTDNGEIQQGLPLVRLLRSPDADEGDDSAAPNPAWAPAPKTLVPGAVRVERADPENLRIRVHPNEQAYAVLRLERFPAWRVLLNGAPCGARCLTREDGLLTVELPAARLSVIEVAWQTTTDAEWGRAVSGGAFLLIGLLFLRERRVMMGRT